MDYLKAKIGNIEFILILIGFLIGERLVSLPRVAVSMAGYGSVLSILLGGIIVLLIALLMNKLSMSFPEKSFYEICEELVGKAISKVVVIVFFLYFFLFASLFARRIAEFSKSILLSYTPTEVIIIGFILVSGYCAARGIPNYAKTSNILLSISLLFIAYSFIASMGIVRVEELRPIFQMESLKSINIIGLGIPTYIGIEIILFLAPYIKWQKNLKKNATMGILLTIIFFLLNVTFIIGILGEKTLYYEYFPVFAAAREMTYEPYFDFRAYIIFASFWLLLVYVVMVGYHYLASMSASSIIEHKNHSVFAVLLIPFFYIFSLLPQNLSEMDSVLRILEKVWMYGIITPILIIFLIALSRKKIKFER